MKPSRVALVTGSSRGIGREIVRQLATRSLQVILTARDTERGDRTVKALRDEGLDVSFQALDVNNSESIHHAIDSVIDQHGRLDVLVNNAAISIDLDVPALEVDPEDIQRTFETNFYGSLRLCQACVPRMKHNHYGRIVNISSGRGSFSKLGACQAGYRISKTALNALTCILADELKNYNILINAMTPGWVRSRMGGLRAPRSVEEGADTAIWLATLPDDGPRGGFFKDRKMFPW